MAQFLWKFTGLFCGLSIYLVNQGHGYLVENNPSRRAEYLDGKQGKYHLEWEVDWSQKRINFNVTVQAKGWILFGLANNNQSRTGADVVVGGVLRQNGKPYFLDGYTTSQEGGSGRIFDIKSDEQEDYTLHSFWESRTSTFLSFSRLLDTCDGYDYPITENKITLLWGYGETDNYKENTFINHYKSGYHYDSHRQSRNNERRGAFEVYLLDPDHTPQIIRADEGTPRVISSENLSTWTIHRKVQIPSNSTAYLCSIHKAPKLLRKHHVIGFDIHFADDVSRARTHHLLLYKCAVPRGAPLDPRTVFEPSVGAPAEACYFPQIMPPQNMPTQYCSEFYTAWAIGSGAYFHPPHVGLPFGASPDEYYMVQVHHDNPQMSANTVVDLRVDLFYTSRLRPQEGGVMGVGHIVPGVPPSALIPPNSANHRLWSHCSPDCTERMLSSNNNNGITITGMFLHSHTSGQRIRLRHFRNNEELPWILFDENYSNQFQPIRHLRKERRILPGDQLTMDCVYDNTWANGTVIGGFTTRQEMCMAFITYYNKVDYSYCVSEIVSEEYRNYFLQIGNVTWNNQILDWVVTSPTSLAGLTVTQVSDNYVDWDDGVKREELQTFQEVHPHVGRCSRNLASRDWTAYQALLSRGSFSSSGTVTGNAATNINTHDDFAGPVSYPFKAKPYIPKKTCSYGG